MSKMTDMEEPRIRRIVETLHLVTRWCMDESKLELFSNIVINEWKIDTEMKMKMFVKFMYENASTDCRFCVDYANMSNQLCLLQDKTKQNPENSEPSIFTSFNFRNFLMAKVLHVFELYLITKNVELINEVDDDEDEKHQNFLQFEESEVIFRMRKLGNVKFLGELFLKEHIGIDTSIITDCLMKLLCNGDDRSFEALSILLKTCGEVLEHDKGIDLNVYFTAISTNLQNKNSHISVRVRAILQQLIDQRNNKWDNSKEFYERLEKLQISEKQKPLVIEDNDDKFIQKLNMVLDTVNCERVGDAFLPIQSLEINTVEKLQTAIEILFQKVLVNYQTHYLRSYAIMCQELTKLKIPITTDTENILNIRIEIVSKCLIEFGRYGYDDSIRRKKLTEIRSSDDPIKECEDNEKFNQYQRQLRLESVTVIGFIGELFNLNMFSILMMLMYLENLSKGIENYRLQCMLKLLKSIGSNLERGDINLDKYFRIINRVINTTTSQFYPPFSTRRQIYELFELRRVWLRAQHAEQNDNTSFAAEHSWYREDVNSYELYGKVNRILDKLTHTNINGFLRQIHDLPIETIPELESICIKVFKHILNRPQSIKACASFWKELLSLNILERKRQERLSAHVVEFRNPDITIDIMTQLLYHHELQKKESKYRFISAVQFTGELFVIKFFPASIVIDLIEKFIFKKSDFYLEALCILLKIVGKELEKEQNLDEEFAELSCIQNENDNSSDVKRMLQDLLKLRKDKWIVNWRT